MPGRAAPHLFAIRQTEAVARWVCPQCDREFAGRQSHVCAPGISVSELLSRHPAWVSDIYAAIIGPLRDLGPIHEDAVDVGVFLKSDRKVAEFRPRVRAVNLALFLPEPIDHPRIARRYRVGADRVVDVVKVSSVVEVDEQLGEWVTSAYDFNTD
jgi:hypothetical protein